MSHVYIGLDGEMTGYLDNGGELCQIGLASMAGSVFCKDIHCDLWRADPEAMAVHGIDPGWLREGAPTAAKVDNDAAYWLAQVVGGTQRAIPVGWGVSYFDMPFIRKYLPKTLNYLTPRSVELGSVAFSIGAAFGLSPNTIKSKSKRYAERQVSSDVKWHNAGFDALASLNAWRYMLETMRKGAYPTEYELDYKKGE